jgi:hypothetical protein
VLFLSPYFFQIFLVKHIILQQYSTSLIFRKGWIALEFSVAIMDDGNLLPEGAANTSIMGARQQSQLI